MAHSFTNLLIHIIFSTKGRNSLIDAELKPHLHAYIGGIIREMSGTALIVNGTSDHIHMLVGLPPTLALSDAMRVVKTNSSRWVHETRRTRAVFGWQSGFGAFSVSQSNATRVAEYIARQEEHHRRISFREEFISFLKKHGIQYDERYLWG